MSTRFKIFFLQGLKRNHSHIGLVSSYNWNVKDCVDEYNAYDDKNEVNFSELARKHQLVNKKGM